MAKRYFEFELYRINIVQEEPNLFKEMSKAITSDEDVVKLLEKAASPKYKIVVSGKRRTFEWAVREFYEYFHEREHVERIYGITLARSIVETTGDIVTDDGIEEGVSESEPPLAETCKLFFYMKRHLMVIERRSAIINSGWRRALEEILKKVAYDLEYTGSVEFEPVPRHEEIIETFRSFERLTRMRVTLRIPNPELSRYARQLCKEMEDGKIREYLQDMKNYSGLNTDDGKLPHAAVEIASAGYKKGEVTFEGFRNKRREVVRTGRTAARGQIQEMRDFVRGMNAIAKTKEARQATTAILNEIDRIAPPSETA